MMMRQATMTQLMMTRRAAWQSRCSPAGTSSTGQLVGCAVAHAL
jgi:hypothetical protein